MNGLAPDLLSLEGEDENQRKEQGHDGSRGKSRQQQVLNSAFD